MVIYIPCAIPEPLINILGLMYSFMGQNIKDAVPHEAIVAAEVLL